MSKQTQISLDFGPEEKQPPASTGDNGAGSDPPRHYVAAGGVGVRVKSYKQTPAPGGGDLFGDVAAAVKASVAVEEPIVKEEPLQVKEEPVEKVPATGEQPVITEEQPVITEEQPVITEEHMHVKEEPVEKPVMVQEPVMVMPAATAPEVQAALVAEDGPLPKRQVSTKGAAARQKNLSPQTPSKRGRKSLKQVSAEADLIEIPVDEVLFSKQYYTMGEVSEMFRVNQSLLRFWESEFDVLQPRKNKKGDRYFRPVDIKNLHLIYHLLRQKKYTIEGAKDFLKNNKKADERFEVVKRLQEIKTFLLEMKAQL
jgi:DNA-binding transcriptional MerR regulator